MGMVRMAAVSPAASGKLPSKTAVNFADATVVLGMIDIGNRQLRTSGQVSGLKGAVRDIAVLPAM
jgi:hypothetical protein